MQEKFQDMESTILTVAESVEVAMDFVKKRNNGPQSDRSEWSLVDCDELQQLVARIEALEHSAAAPSGALGCDHD